MTERKFKRIPSSILIDIYETNSAVPKGRGCIVDVSMGGLAIETEASLPIGDELFMRIFVHDRKEAVAVELYGKIMRFQSEGNIFRYGLKYTRLGLFGKYKLRKEIDRLIHFTQHSETTAG